MGSNMYIAYAITCSGVSSAGTRRLEKGEVFMVLDRDPLHTKWAPLGFEIHLRTRVLPCGGGNEAKAVPPLQMTKISTLLSAASH